MNEQEKEIDDYIRGRLSAAAAALFEEKLAADPDLREEVAFERALIGIFEEGPSDSVVPTATNPKVAAYEAFLQSEQGQQARQQLKHAEAAYFKKKAVTPLNNRRWFYSAAAVAVFVLGFLGLWQWNRPADPLHLYTEYRNDWSELPALGTRGSTTSLSEAEHFFLDGEYEKAYALYKNNLPTKEEDSYALAVLHTGVSALEAGETAAALGYFEQLGQSGSLDADKAYWYTALTYLKTKRPQQAKKALEQLIRSPQHFKYAEAKALLRRLD